MEELQLALTTSRVDQRNFGVWINNWQVGQALSALVTGQRPSGELVLRVGGQQITATADIPVQQGARLLLEVKSLEPVPTLRILNPVATNPSSTPVGGTLQLLPGSGTALASSPLSSVTQTLQNAQLSMALPPVVSESVNQLLRQTSRPAQLAQAGGVAKAVNGSGIFLESEMEAVSQGRVFDTGDDMKAGLFRVLARVEEALTKVQAAAMSAADAEMLLEVKRELEGGLGRITLQQLNSQPVEGQAARAWQLELPVQLAGSFHSLMIHLEHEPGRGDGDTAAESDEDTWRVKLRLAPGALGLVEVSMQLCEDELALRLSAERSDVRAIMDAGLPTLERALKSHGLRLSTTATVPIEQAAKSASANTGDADRRSLSIHA